MRRKVKEVTMAKAALNDGQVIYAVNDLFIGQRTYVSSRYHITAGSRQEYRSSSRVIISTGLGSNGWLKSIITGAANITNEILVKRISVQKERKLEWDMDCLYFSVC